MSRVLLQRLAGDEFVDEIRIVTVPRFKTSGLSGDEWRVSAHVQVLRKGRLVGERSWNSICDALPRLQKWVYDELLSPIANPRMTEDLCMQPGCHDPWTVQYRVVEHGCSSCGSVRAVDVDDGLDYRRRFCERHANRGDASLHDSNSNYAPMPGAAAPAEHVVREQDESPSLFVGIVGPDGAGG